MSCVCAEVGILLIKKTRLTSEMSTSQASEPGKYVSRTGFGTKKGVCNSHLGLYTNLDPQKYCIRTALSASPMSISACHLGYFFAILKTQVSEKPGPPLSSVSSHKIGFPIVHFTQFVIYIMPHWTMPHFTQRTRIVRECCRSDWGGTTACNSAQFRPLLHQIGCSL